MLCIKEQEKEEKIKTNVSLKKEIINIRPEINKIETKKSKGSTKLRNGYLKR